MDPISLGTAAAAAVRAVYQVSTTLYSFIQGVMSVEQSMQSFIDEVDCLKTAIIAVETGLRSPALRNQSGSIIIDLRETIDSVSTSLSRCQLTLERFDQVLISIKGREHARTSPFRQAFTQIKLDFHASDIVMYRAKIATHTTSMQISLQMLIVHISCRAPIILSANIEPKLDVLIDLVAGLNLVHERPRVDLLIPELEEESIDYSEIRLQRAAEQVISRARSVASSISSPSTASTAWEGSVTAGSMASSITTAQEVPIANYRLPGNDDPCSISRWTLGVVREEARPARNEADWNLPSQRELEENFDTEVFTLLVKEGKSLCKNEKAAEAERIYLRALERPSMNASSHDRNDARLQLANVYLKLRKFEAGQKLLASLIASIIENDSQEPESDQLIQGMLMLAQVHWECRELHAAEKHCKDAMLASRRILGRTSAMHLQSVSLLVRIYEAKGDEVLAAAYRSMLSPQPSSQRNTHEAAQTRITHVSPLSALQSPATPHCEGIPEAVLYVETARKTPSQNANFPWENFADLRGEAGDRCFELHNNPLTGIWKPDITVLGLQQLEMDKAKYKKRHMFGTNQLDRGKAVLRAVEERDIPVLWVLLFNMDQVRSMWERPVLGRIVGLTLAVDPETYSRSFTSELGGILYKACCLGTLDIVRMLLEYSTTLKDIWKFSSETPLIAAARNGHYHLFDVLLLHSSTIQNVGSKGKKGDTAFSLVLSDGSNEAAACTLVEHGADVNTTLGNKTTGVKAIVKCRQLGWDNAVKKLIQYGTVA